MEDNYIMLNGKKVPLTEEQVAALLGGKETACAKVEPFEPQTGQNYFYISDRGEVFNEDDHNLQCDKKRYNVGNYCTDYEMMNQRAMHETLNRLLWRYSEQHGGDAEWDRESRHFYIRIDDKGEPFWDWFVCSRPFGPVYFKDMETAICAIEDVVKPFLAEHPDFVW